MSLPPEDNSDYEEAQLGGFSPITTRAAARRKAERFDAFQQTEQFSPGPSTYKEKVPERNPSSPTSEHRLDRLEIMMEKLLGTVQVLAEARSHRSSPPISPLRTFPEIHESSDDPPAPHIGPQDQFLDPVPPPQVQPPVLPPMTNPTIPATTDERDQSLEDALAKSRANRLARANIQGDGFQTPAKLKPHEEAIAPVPTEYLRDAFQRVLDYMSLHPQEPGDPPQRPAPRLPRAHPIAGNEPRHPAPSYPSTSRSNPPPRVETRTRQNSLGETEPIVSGKVNKIPSDILQPLDPVPLDRSHPRLGAIRP